MVGGSAARTLDYLWVLVDASAWALFSALVTDICVKFKQGAGVVLGSILLWFCAGRRSRGVPGQRREDLHREPRWHRIREGLGAEDPGTLPRNGALQPGLNLDSRYH